MRNKLLAILLCIGIVCPFLSAVKANAAHAYTAAEVESLCGGIIAYKQESCGAGSIQSFIDTELCSAAGTTAEYYVITLSQSGDYDFSKYESALLRYLKDNEVYSATTKEKYALALIASGSTDSYIKKVCDNEIGGLGLMSLVFGLHLLNNGYSSAAYSEYGLISEILSCQLSDGGWAVIGSAGDADVTAMTIQALAPYYGGYSEVMNAVDRALELLSSRQLSSGGFISMGAENPESAAQVLTALSALGIDQSGDTRFIKNGNTILDAMLNFRRADGSFSHDGSGYNENATIQAMYSLCAYQRMLSGRNAFYILDRRRPDEVKSDEKSGSEGGSPSNGKNSDNKSSGNKNADGKSAETKAQSGGKAESTADASTKAPTEPYRGDYTAPTGSVRFQPVSEAVIYEASPDEAASGKGGYKLYAILAVIAAALIVSAILFACKKRNIKNYTAVLILASAAIVFILLTNFESKEAYSKATQKGSVSGTVTMTIRCDTVIGEDDLPAYIPEDGVILSTTEFAISEGDTAYDILLEASKTRGIHIDNRGGETNAYIAGIQYLYEYDYGELSGWMYRVNGEFPQVGCRSCTLTNGDSIEWLYTKDIGKDLY